MNDDRAVPDKLGRFMWEEARTASEIMDIVYSLVKFVICESNHQMAFWIGVGAV